MTNDEFITILRVKVKNARDCDEWWAVQYFEDVSRILHMIDSPLEITSTENLPVDQENAIQIYRSMK